MNNYFTDSLMNEIIMVKARIITIWALYILLLHDVASGSEIVSCNKINKPLLVYRFCKVTL